MYFASLELCVAFGSWETVRMANSSPEPMLTFKLSDKNDFYCSACQQPVASLGNGRFIVATLHDLIAVFREHVRRCHTEEDANGAFQ